MTPSPEGGSTASRIPDRWLVLRVPRPEDPDLAALAVEELLSLSSRGVEEDGDELVVYLPPPDGGDVATLVEGVRDRLGTLLGRTPDVATRWQAHEAWEERWRRGLAPRRVTPRIVVSPSWCDPELRPDELLVTIDPGMAFGTAEHPTTRGSLRLLDELVEAGQRVADVGAGSGILSIAAALLGADPVLAVESDGWACEAARENVERNRVADRVRVLETAVTPRFLPQEAPFDGVVANIESRTLLPLLEGFAGGIAPGGWLVLSGILRSEADGVREAAKAAGFRFVSSVLEQGWWSGAFLNVPSGRPGGAPGSGGRDRPKGRV